MGAYEALRSRDFRLLAGGTVLSTLGQQMLAVAVGWDLYERTRSPLALGNIGLVQVLPVLLFALASGQVADRYDRRRVIVLTQLPQLLSALALMGLRSVVAIYGCLFLIAVARTFQSPAASALLPRVAPVGGLTNAIAWSSSGREVASMAGPAIGGLLLAAFGSEAVYLAQAGCALLALVCFAALRTHPPVVPVAPAPGSRAIVEGLRFVWHDKLLLAAMSLDMFAVLFGGAVALLPIYATDILGVGAHGLGWLRAAPAVGAFSMALVIAHLPPIHRAGAVLLWAVAGFGVATVGFGLSRVAWLSWTLLLLTGALDNISVVLRQSLVQTRTPDALRGRVLAVNSVFISMSNQLGAAESGLAAAWFGPVASVVGGGVATLLVVGTLAIGSRPLRRWRMG